MMTGPADAVMFEGKLTCQRPPNGGPDNVKIALFKPILTI
jgi:hypothetical protein